MPGMIWWSRLFFAGFLLFMVYNRCGFRGKSANIAGFRDFLWSQTVIRGFLCFRKFMRLFVESTVKWRLFAVIRGICGKTMNFRSFFSDFRSLSPLLAKFAKKPQVLAALAVFFTIIPKIYRKTMDTQGFPDFLQFHAGYSWILTVFANFHG